MTDRPEITDVPAVLDVLGRHGVRYVVVGGQAGTLLGSVTITKDLDICYARDNANLSALAEALTELEATLRGAPAGLPFRPDAPTLKAGLNFTFATKFGPLDCLGELGAQAALPPRGLEREPRIAMAFGHLTYELLEPNAERMRIGAHDVLVASLDDLIRMKRAAGRPQDIIEVERLSALREVREELAPYVVGARRKRR